MKISGSVDVTLNGINIENLVDYTNLGHDLCGKKDLYHFSQQNPYQIGFCMNMAHAIAIDFSDVLIEDDININGVYSKTGLAFGISTWFDTKITYEASVTLTNVYAGYDLKNFENKLLYSDRPNKAPEACAIRIFSSDSYKVSNIFNNPLITEKDNIKIKCINGNVGCYGNEHSMFTNLGKLLDDDEIEFEEEIKCNELPPVLLDDNDKLILLNDAEKNEILIIEDEEEENKKRKQNIFSSFDSSPIFFLFVAIFGIIILCISKKIYHDYAYNKIRETDFKYKLLNTSDQDQELYGTFNDDTNKL